MILNKNLISTLYISNGDVILNHYEMLLATSSQLQRKYLFIDLIDNNSMTSRKPTKKTITKEIRTMWHFH